MPYGPNSCSGWLGVADHDRYQEGEMPQKGQQKQNPPDQRARGMNKEHAEGQANAQNQAAQAGAKQPAPAPKERGQK